MKIKLLSLSLLLALSVNAQVKVLFDATKAEMAGNADWVVDADQYNLGYNSTGAMVTGAGNEANPQRIPTATQSSITSTTSETYWKGALSSWAVDLAKRGYVIETLPYNGQITYGVTTNTQDLANYKIFVVDEPNIRFSASEKVAIINFVKNGGGLMMISDHTVSDRNNDGWDSPAIWNDLMSTNTVKANPFGITFDLQNFSQTTTNIVAITNSTILHGPAGNVTGLVFNNGTSMTLNKTANSTATGLIYKTGASATGTTLAMFASSIYGTGKVCAIGDSSPIDDGTGDTNDALYSSYSTAASGSHRKLLINAISWLSSTSVLRTVNPIETGTTDADQFMVYPNPASDQFSIRFDLAKTAQTRIVIADITGKLVQDQNVEVKEGESVLNFSLENIEKGIYFITVTTDHSKFTKRLVVQ